jgi:hypothetical protein
MLFKLDIKKELKTVEKTLLVEKSRIIQTYQKKHKRATERQDTENKKQETDTSITTIIQLETLKKLQ